MRNSAQSRRSPVGGRTRVKWKVETPDPRYPRYNRIAALIVIAVCLPTQARADETFPIATPLRTQAVLVNPIAPLLGMGLSAAGIDSVLVGIKYHQALDKRLGFSIQPAFGYARFLFRMYVVGVKFGPRISLSRRGLAGWYLFPMAIAGWGWMQSRSGIVLASAPLVGIGLASGYAFHWGGFAVELGAGLQYSAFMWDRPGGENANLIPVKPELTVNVGYAW